MAMIITFWVTSTVLWIISVWTEVFFCLFFPPLGSIRPCLTDPRFLLHIISPRRNQTMKDSLSSNISAKAFQIFITSSPLIIHLPLSICMGFMSCVVRHELVHELLHCALMATWMTWIPCGDGDAVLSALHYLGTVSPSCAQLHLLGFVPASRGRRRNITRPDQRKFEWITPQSEDRQPSGRVTAWLDFPLSGAIRL